MNNLDELNLRASVLPSYTQLLVASSNKISRQCCYCVLGLVSAASTLLAPVANGGDLFEVIPLTWISGTSCGPHDNATGAPVIFPSIAGNVGIDPVGVEEKLDNILLKNNRIPAILIQFPLISSPTHKINILRTESKGSTLILSASAATIKEIRKLNWTEFQLLQREFACWLIRLNEPKYLFDYFRKPIDGFQHPIEEKLLEFWHRVLTTASFDAFAADKAVKDRYFPTHLSRSVNGRMDSPGKRMGAIPLRPGMRLAIHWGGTALYGLGYENITRQTNTGTSTIDLVEESKSCVLAPLSERALGRLKAVAVFGGVPNQVGEEAIADKILPFGNKPATLTDKVIPVFNEFDLRNKMLLSPISGVVGKGDLLLLIPSEYSKSDPGDDKDNKFWSTDAIGAEAGSPDAGLVPSVFRRFVIWQSTRNMEQKDLEAFNPVFSTGGASPGQAGDGISYWPGVFGNQTWVDVEVPVSMNGQPPAWVPFKMTLAEFLERNAARLLDPSPNVGGTDPLFSFSRRLPTTGLSYTFVEFRFWTAPSPTLLKQTQLHPGDSLSFRP